ncbi:hypothetical protein D3C79_904100 [compost metagenome]
MAFDHWIFLWADSGIKSGKYLKHRRNKAVVTDSTTNCVKAKSGARKITKKKAIE